MEFLWYILTAFHNGFHLVIDAGTGTQLTGKEGPLFLYPVISCWTSERAYKEGRDNWCLY